MRVLVFLFLSLLIAFSAELKVASFNTENLFDDRCDGSEYREFRGACLNDSKNWNSQKYLKKLKEITLYINELNPDIIALQEIENIGVLETLAKKSGYKFYKFAKPKNSPFGVGILSKIPIKNSKIYSIDGVKARDILRGDFEFEGVEFSVFTLHFLSLKNPKVSKKKEFNTLLKVVNGRKNSIILGDFNEEYGSNSMLKPLEKSGYKNLWGMKFGFERNSHISGRAIDHILLSRDFFEARNSKNGLYFKDFSVAKESKISDHKALVLTLTSKKPKEKSGVKLETIADIYKFRKISAPLRLKNLAITYKDKFGYTISEAGGRGIYVYDRKNSFEISDQVEATIYEVGEYKNNLEVKDADITKTGKANLQNYSKKSFKNTLLGDTIFKASGEVKDGYLISKDGKIRIYSKSRGKLKNSKFSEFENAMIVDYRGEKELLVR